MARLGSATSAGIGTRPQHCDSTRSLVWGGGLPRRAGAWPGVDWEPGLGVLEVAVEHDGQCALPVVAWFGGGEGGALPGCASLPTGRPGGDHLEQRVRLGRRNAGVEQSLP